jgi:hypothetical protein
VTDNSAAITAACAASPNKIYIPSGNYAITPSTYTIPCPWEVLAGGSIVIPNAVTVTADYCPIASPAQIFTIAGSGAVAMAQCDNARAEWWAATQNSGSYTDGATINLALTAAHSVQLLQGNYYGCSVVVPVGKTLLGAVQSPGGGSQIYCNSASATQVTLNPTSSQLQDVVLIRSVAASVGANGILVNGNGTIGYQTVQNVHILDSPNAIALTNGPGGSSINNVLIGYTSVSSTSVTQYGVNITGGCNSTNFRDVNVLNQVGSTLHVDAMYMHGGAHDCFVDWLQDTSADWLVYYDGSTGQNYDNHFMNPNSNSNNDGGFYLYDLAGTQGPAISINGGYAYNNANAPIQYAGTTVADAVSVVNYTNVASGYGSELTIDKKIPNPFAALASAGLSCSAALEGSFAYVTDSTTNIVGATISGGGSYHVTGYCNGTNYVVGSGGSSAVLVTVFTITASSTPAIVASNGGLQTITLNANSTPTISGIAAGQRITFQICQPASGGPYTWTWPSAVHGGMTIGTTASTCSEQTFDSFSGSTLVAESTIVTNVAP